MADLRAADKLAKGGQPYQPTGSATDPVAPSLAEQGIDKNLVDRARKAAMGADKFDAALAKGKALAEAAVRSANAQRRQGRTA